MTHTNIVNGLRWKEGLVCDINVVGNQLEHVLKFKYLGSVSDELSTGWIGMLYESSKWKVAIAIL